MNNDFLINLENFQGPLDLLLFLIRKNEIDIYNIPIAQITEEYLNTLELMNEMNLEVAGDFLVMASTLIYIKGRMLLPVQKEANGSNEDFFEDPRSELVKILTEYQKFKDLGLKLGEREILGRDVFKHMKKNEKKETILENIEMINLIKAYYNLIDKYRGLEKIQTISSKNVNDKLSELILKFPNGFKNLKLEELLEEPVSKIEIIITFLTVLELTRLSFLKILQEDEEIFISTLKPLNTMNIEKEIFNLQG